MPKKKMIFRDFIWLFLSLRRAAVNASAGPGWWSDQVQLCIRTPPPFPQKQ